MSTPLTATDRFEFEVFVSGLPHKIHAYCKRTVPLMGAEQIINRDGSTPMDAGDSAQGFWNGIRGIFDTTVVAPSVVLQNRSGIVWNPVASYTLTDAGSAGGSIYLASQLTVLINDTAFKKIRLTLMEPNEGYVGHSPTGLGITGTIDAMIPTFTDSSSASNSPFFWMKSRGDNYIAASGAVRGATLDLNDKLKRRRGLE